MWSFGSKIKKGRLILSDEMEMEHFYHNAKH